MTTSSRGGERGDVQVVANVVDLKPSKADPKLQLSFDRDDAAHVVAADRDKVMIVAGGEQWRGTVGWVAGASPLLHTNLRSGDAKQTVTEWLRRLGVKDGGKLRFRAAELGHLELLEVVDEGASADLEPGPLGHMPTYAMLPSPCLSRVPLVCSLR